MILTLHSTTLRSERDRLGIKHGQIPISVLEERVRKVQRRAAL